MSNAVERIVEIIRRKKNVDISEITSFLDGVLEQLNSNGDDLYTITDSEKVLSYLKNNNMLDENELEFLNGYYHLNPELRNSLFDEGVLPESELEILKSLKEKVKIVREEMGKLKSFNYVNLGRKFNEKNSLYITDDEITKVIELMKENGFSTEDTIEVLKKMLLINSDIFEKDCIIGLDDERTLSEDDLLESNIDIDFLKNLFNEYAASYEFLDEDLLRKIARYADVEKIRGVLEFIKENKIEFVFKDPDVFAPMLLFSSKKDLLELKSCIVSNGNNFIEYVENRPTVLYPTSRSLKNPILKHRKPGGDRGNSSNVSGCLNKYVNNTKLLQNYGISPALMEEKCSMFFFNSVMVNKLNFENLALYDIPYVGDDGKFAGIFCTFGVGKTGLLDSFDAAIEAGCKDYALDSPSLLRDKSLYYLIKYANKKDNLPLDNIILNFYSDSKKSKLNKKTILEKYKDYILTASAFNQFKIFSDYKAANFQFEQRDIYDNILELQICNKISPLVFENEIIQRLENFGVNNNEYVYMFDGVCISRLKVLRLYSALLDNGKELDYDSLMYLITKNSMLDEHELSAISKCVKEKVIQPRGVGEKK